MGAYSVTKAAVVALSETLYTELAPEGIGVTVLCPTFFQTGILDASRGADGDLRQLVGTLMSEARIGAEDVAEMALRGVERKKLYVVPQADGRWMWRLKRLVPGLFHRLAPRAIEAQTKRMREKEAGR
jgi:short-subunit dehydrogenase